MSLSRGSRSHHRRSLLSNLLRLEDRLTPAIAIMGPHTLQELQFLADTKATAWSALAQQPAPVAGQVSYFDAPNAWYFGLDSKVVTKKLDEAPDEFAAGYNTGSFVMSLPSPNGTFQQFRIWEASIMEPELADEFPHIHTYRGQGLDDPTATLAADVTPLGFHAQVLSPHGAYYIDPYYHLQQSAYVAYYKTDLINHNGNWVCLAGATDNDPETEQLVKIDHGTGCSCALCQMATHVASSGGATASKTNNGSILRTYRAAVAGTVEYTAFFGGTVANGQASIVTAMNRVDGVYENELAVRMVLVANNSSLVYTSTDPYTNNNVSTMLDENQLNIDTVIGSNNYDIGHVFSTSNGGGIAGLGVVTVAGSKAEGATGNTAPTGDAYWIDYVAHEMGHQFDADHTFNSSALAKYRYAPTAYEPGSGSTIMAYAGLGDNYQQHSDPYFHSASLDEITDFIASHPGNTNTATGNASPTVNAGLDYTIPAATPFALTAVGVDANGDPLTYDWQERDLGAADLLTTADNARSPNFRPFSPTTNPTRTFPTLTSILNNTTSTGEKPFTVSRTSNYRVTVRDNKANGGAFNMDDMKLTVVNTGSAFAVTSPNTFVTWIGGSTQTIAWNVAGTTANGINAALVNILLSTDGGFTFPTTLAAATLNDGSENVIIPNTVTSTARIKVQPVGNVFFDIGNANFSIISGSSLSVTAVTPASGSVVTLPFTQIDVTFSADIDPATVGTNDLNLSTGSVADAQLISPQAVRFTIAGLTAEGPLTATVPQNAVSDLSANGNNSFVANYTLDYGTTALPTPLTRVGVDGALAYTGATTGTINSSTDSDAFTITLDAGQSASVLLTAAASLGASVNFSGPGGVNQTNNASTLGGAVVVQSVPVATSGVYTITVSSLASTSGSYSLRFDLNSAVESEGNDGSVNDTTAMAQALSTSVDLGGATLATVRGRTDQPAGSVANETEGNNSTATANDASADFAAVANSTIYQMTINGTILDGVDTDYFNIGAMQVGDVITITQAGVDTGRGVNTDPLVYLYRANSGTSVTVNDDRATGFPDSLIYRFTVTTADTYYIRAYSYAATDIGTYQITAYLENTGTMPSVGTGVFNETEANDTKGTANNASARWKRVNYNSSIIGAIGSGSDVDYYKYTFAAGDILTATATSNGGEDLALAFFDANGNLLYDEKGASTAFGLNSVMYSYSIVNAGAYYVRVSSSDGTTGSYTLNVDLGSSITPPTPTSGYDFFSLTTTAGQPIALGIKGLAAGSLDLDLLDAGGNSFLSGLAGATNFDKSLTYTPLVGGTLYARISGTPNVDYQLVVTGGAAQDTEANDDFNTAQPLTNNRAAGAITTSEDWYQFTATAGQQLTLTTTTPGDGPGEFVNYFDPIIELFDPNNISLGSDDNSAVDGHNAVLTRAVTTTGSFRARVRGANATMGEYTLALAVSADAPPQVASVQIDDGSVQRSMIKSLTVTFSEIVTLPATPASAFVLTRQNTSDTVTLSANVTNTATQTVVTLTFSGPATNGASLADGRYTFTVLGGQVTDSAAQSLAGGDYVLGAAAAPNPPTNIFRLFGDANGDGAVNGNDFLAFRLSFLQNVPTFDFDGNNTVDGADFLQFRLHFLQMV